MARLLRDVCVAGVLSAILLLLRSADAATCYQFWSKDDYPYCVQLDANLVLYWRTIDNKTLELVPDADGYMNWLAVGISEAGMKGVDFIVIYIPEQGESWVTGDFFTSNFTEITKDKVYNVKVADGPDYSKDNHTYAVIQRPLDSCDIEDTPVYPDVERTIIWAYDWDILWDKAKVNLSKYTRGMRTGVRLFTSTNSTPPAATSSTTLRVAMPNYTVPDSPTSTACVNLALPNASSFQVVQYQGFRTSSLAVRIAGYVCASGVVPQQPVGVPYDCSTYTQILRALPASLPVGCETLNFIWVPGTGAFQAPPEAGFLIGAGAATTMVLQVVYWNLAGVMGQVDTSGFDLVYTPAVRANNMGVLTVGSTDMQIPANNGSYTALPNICAADCTSQRVLSPVTLVSSLFIMGSLGSSVRTRHIRNGAAIMPVGQIDYYDQKYPGFQTVSPASRTLFPNDTLITVCTYNSTGVKGNTYFGYKNGSELCFNYITFYPTTAMPDLDYCIARTRDNLSSCSTRTSLTSYAQNPPSDKYWNGTQVKVAPLSIASYEPEQCNLPKHKPNTKAAVASIILVPVALLFVGAILWTKYSKQEELERLLEQARTGTLDPLPSI